ncbi:MAG: hypothetical protein ABI539_04925 [Acidobacteriota bacterium]
MKVCPTCRKSYDDDGLNFCLDDGSVLKAAGAGLPETVMMSQPRPTDPNTVAASGLQTSWDAQPQYSVQPKKSSKTWVWILLILGGIVLLCGGGFAGMIAFVSINKDANQNRDITGVNNSKQPTPTASPFDSTSVQTVDLSEWVRDSSEWGDTEFSDDELIMSSKKKRFYYVLVAPEEYKTDGATTRVTVRNLDDVDSALGYGLIFSSDTTPLIRDYAFLINAKKKKYRVVRHEPANEVSIVNWTTSPLINDGSEENVLEVRDKSGTMELYINGQLVTSFKDTLSRKGGVAGLYSGDAVKAAFKKLEIAK